MKVMIKLHHIIIGLVIFLMMFLGKIFTKAGLNWYRTINLPAFTPPNYAFSLAWTIIFICMGISANIVYKKLRRDSAYWFIVGFYLLNMIFNILWSFLFFYQRAIFAALIDAMAIELTLIGLIVLLWNRSKTAALLLLPYFFWVAFAIYLNYTIVLLN